MTSIRIKGFKQPRVTRLLQKKPDLAMLVTEAADELAKFIPDGRLRLEPLPDPDYGEDEQLFLGVHTGLPEDEALEALRRFDQEWWVHKAARSHGLLCIDLSDE